MMQLRIRPDGSRGTSAVDQESPQPIDFRAIEAEFYGALGDDAVDDEPHAEEPVETNESCRSALPIEPEATSRLSKPRPDTHRDGVSPARRLAAPMFIATCLVLGLLTHDADANRLLNFWPQTSAPAPRAESTPGLSGAWRQIGRYLDAMSGRETVSAQPADIEKVIEEPSRQGDTTGGMEPPAQPAAPQANPLVDADRGEALFIPIAIDVICAIPVVFDMARSEPATGPLPAVPQASLTDLYPFEPWSMRPEDAGPVGRAQVVVQAIATGIRITAQPPPRAEAPPAPVEKATIKPKPVRKPVAAAKERPAAAPTPPPAAPSTPAWSRDAFRF